MIQHIPGGNATAMRLSVRNDQEGQPSWWLYADNHRLVAWAGATFTSVADAARAAVDFRNYAATAEFDVYDAVGGKWSWQAWLTENKVAVSTNGYTTKQNARRAANNVRDNAVGATGP